MKKLIIGAVLLTILLLTAFNTPTLEFIKLDEELGGVYISKKMTPNDPPCLQMYYYIEQYADSFDIPKNYAYGIAYKETRYEGPFHWTYNHKKTSKGGAVGPMQIKPSTTRTVSDEKFTVTKLKNNIELNVKTSLKLVRQLYDKYGNWKLAFGCYNTGKPIVNNYAVFVYNYKADW